jgi:hypothetical protein
MLSLISAAQEKKKPKNKRKHLMLGLQPGKTTRLTARSRNTLWRSIFIG